MSRLDLAYSGMLYSNPKVGVTVYNGSIRSGTTLVAIKEQRHQNVESLNSVISEAMAQAKLTHPNVCQIYEAFLQVEGGCFLKSVLVLEMMQRDLMEEIKRRAGSGEYWSEYELLCHLHNLCSALLQAKSLSIAHRDIKPQNILLSYDGQLKLSDFGSSKMNVEYFTATLQGTPFYLSPELKKLLCNYSAGKVDESAYDPYKSDVYSLGMTMAYMASLCAPYELSGLKERTCDLQIYLQKFSHFTCLQQVLVRMLAEEPAARCSFEEVVAFTKYYIDMWTAPAVPQQVTEEEKKSESSVEVDKCVKCKAGFSQDAPAEMLLCTHKLHQKCYFSVVQTSKEIAKIDHLQCPECSTLSSISCANTKLKPRIKKLLDKDNRCIICDRGVEEKNTYQKYPECQHAICRYCYAERPEKCPNCSFD